MIAQQIRKSILDLAIRGKLVPQDPNDEPASVLIDRIRAEKERLIREKKLKKDKNSSYIFRGSDKVFYEVRNGAAPVPIDDQLPFDIPDSWTWARLGEVVINRDSERIPVSQRDRDIRAKIFDYYGASGIIDKIDDYLFDKQLLLIGEDGANLIHRSTPIAFIAKGKYWVNNHAHVLDSPFSEILFFLCEYINSINIIDYVSGTAQPKLNQDKLNSIFVPLPPLNEQKRILKSVKNINALAYRLNDSEKQIGILKGYLHQQTLRLAVQGKLVPQLPEEGTAHELLSQIRAEKERLVQEGKLKSSALAAPAIERRGNSYYENGRCIDAEIPFDIPDSWAWVRIRDCMDLRAGKFITANAISPVETESTPYMCYGGHGLRGYVSTFNTRGRHALIGRQGALCGNVQLAEGDFYATEHAIVVSLYGGLDVEWVYYFVRALNLNQYSTATAQPGLSVATINDVYIPLPPLGEQKRIVLALKKTESLITNR